MNILIADENSAVRYGVAVLLEELPQARILGEAANFRDLHSLMRAGCPDLLLLSWELPGLNGANLLQAVRLICPRATIVVLSSQSEAAEQARAGGADAFVSKAEPPEQLWAVIKNYSSR